MSFMAALALLMGSCVIATVTSAEPSGLIDARNWYALGQASLSPDARYVAYSVMNFPKGSSTMVIRATRGGWKMEKEGCSYVGFFQNDQLALLQERQHTLLVLRLGTDSAEQIPGVAAACIFRVGHSGDWLVYQTATPEKALVLRNLATGEEKRVSGVTKFQSPYLGNRWLLVHRIEVKDGSPRKTLVLVGVDRAELTTVWSADALDDQVLEPHLVFDQSHEAMAWATDVKQDSQSVSTIWYFKTGMTAPENLVSSVADGVGNGAQLPPAADLQLKFVTDGNMLCFNLAPRSEPSGPKPGMASVDVWSYKDSTVQSMQLRLIKSGASLRRTFLEIHSTAQAAIRISDRQVIRLAKSLDNDELLIDSMNDSNVLVVRGHGGYPDEWHWNPASRFDVVLLSLKDGTERVLCQDLAHWFAQHWSLSPDGRQAVYYNPTERNWFARDLISGSTRNLTASCQTNWTDYYLGGQEEPDDLVAGQPIWLENGTSFLLYSRNDIWRIDLDGSVKPVNLTRRHTSRPEAVFRFAARSWELSGHKTKQLSSSVVAEAFDQKTKDQGFLKIQPDGREPDGQVSFRAVRLRLANPTEAVSNTAGWLVSMETASSSPNLYFTGDFLSYTPLSDLHPENGNHGITAELLTWKSLSGRETQGVLYKPDDFDPQKKYPVIFEYYQSMSDSLNQYLGPLTGKSSSGGLYMPYLVGQGYLVFRVDVLPGIRGQPGKTAYDAVVSGAHLLATKPWVDAKHMGLRGQSFGAYETDYIVAHTGLFAAAVATSGWADYVAAYNAIILPSGPTRAPAYERGREWMHGTLWEFPCEYIENSPIFQADKVTTPMLLMNNVADADVNFYQGVEWFNALRRLGKKAWMLQYDNGGHFLSKDEDVADFDRRMMQFYNHYLKDAPPPKWMMEGIPAKLKGYETGFELDTSGREP